MTEKLTVLKADGVCKSFPARSGSGTLEILRDVNLSIHASEFAAIVGPSGSGKSTLLHLLGGLDRPDKGTIHWNHKAVTEWSSDKLAEERNRQIGFIFQFHHLLPEFSALENVFMPALIGGIAQDKAEQRATSLLARLGLSERLDHQPAQLSGGEQQRVSIARALMNNPSIILADEPTGNLDEENTLAILDQLEEIRNQEQVAMVLITHEKEIAARCDRTYELRHSELHPHP